MIQNTNFRKVLFQNRQRNFETILPLFGSGFLAEGPFAKSLRSHVLGPTWRADDTGGFVTLLMAAQRQIDAEVILAFFVIRELYSELSIPMGSPSTNDPDN